MRIPPPAVRSNAGAKAYPYPCQISFQTLEFLQGALLMAIVGNISSGEYFKMPGSMEKLNMETSVGETFNLDPADRRI